LTLNRGAGKNFFVGKWSTKAVLISLSFFLSAVLCASLAGPSAAGVLASQHEDQLRGCAAKANLNLLCTSGSPLGSLSGSLAVSSLARDLFKDGFFPIGAFPQRPSDNIDLTAEKRLKVLSDIHPAQKIRIHLSNSVLTV
jgi:hypothetical protein